MGLLSSIGGFVPKALTKIGGFLKEAAPSILGSIGQSALGLGSDYLANKYIGQPQAAEAYSQSKEASALAYSRQKEMFKNRYNWTMADMKASGLNPILAASSGGFNVSGGPTVQKAQAFQAHSPYGAGASSARGFSQASESQAKVKQAVQTVVESKANTKRAFAQTRQILSQTKVLNATEENLRKKWFNIEQQFNQITQQIGESQARVRQIQTQTDLN